MSARRRAEDTAPRRRHYGRWIALALLVGVLLMGYWGWSFLPVRGDATQARDDLVAARDALQADDEQAAVAHVESARDHVDSAQDAVGGVAGTVWSAVPVLGGGVSDVRHMVDALDKAIGIAEIGVELYPQVLGEDAALVDGDDIDLGVLTQVSEDGIRAGDLAVAAEADLREVEGEAPVIGGELGRMRDEALAEIEPLIESYGDVEPALRVLPEMLGAEGEKKYILAVLNPSELRYSGGASLGLSTMRVTDGDVKFRDLGNVGEARGTQRLLYWKKVPGNPFHIRGKQRFQTATFSPYWSVSGEELLRAWAKVTREEFDGVIAVDVVALADLFRVTGPVATDGYGELNADNVVQTLVGSYELYPDPVQRQRLNDAVLPIFRDQFLTGGQFTEKLQALGDAADRRHVAVYLRDEEGQDVVRNLGVDGDLEPAEKGDYVGVFSQNTNGAKVDYHQRRTIRSQVRLREDGSADVAVTTTIDNATPPYAGPPDIAGDRTGSYFTRWSYLSLATFMPPGAELQEVRVGGNVVNSFVRTAQGRPYVAVPVELAPATSQQVTVRYRVADAAERDGDTWRYALSFDPQGMVNDTVVGLQVTGPDGTRARGLAEGWQREGDAAVLPDTPMPASTTWTVEFR